MTIQLKSNRKKGFYLRAISWSPQTVKMQLAAEKAYEFRVATGAPTPP